MRASASPATPRVSTDSAGAYRARSPALACTATPCARSSTGMSCMTHSIHADDPATSLNRTSVLGWDIGGVNTKASRVDIEDGRLSRPRGVSAPLEMQRDSAALVPTLRRLAAALGGGH